MADFKNNAKMLNAAWAVAPQSKDDIRGILSSIDNVLPDNLKKQAMMGAFNEESYWPTDPDSIDACYRPYNLKDGILYIDVVGLLMSGLREQVGNMATGYIYIRQAITRGLSDPEVFGITLCIDSIGGHAQGCIELADFIHDVRHIKPIKAMIVGDALSAGYFVASAASEIYMTISSTTGSIGVLFLHYDISEQLKADGVKVTPIIVGARKADGLPMIPLSDAAKNTILAQLIELYDIFVFTIARNRGITEESVRQTEAITMGAKKSVEGQSFADGIIDPSNIRGFFIGIPQKQEGASLMTLPQTHPALAAGKYPANGGVMAHATPHGGGFVATGGGFVQSGHNPHPHAPQQPMMHAQPQQTPAPTPATPAQTIIYLQAGQPIPAPSLDANGQPVIYMQAQSATPAPAPSATPAPAPARTIVYLQAGQPVPADSLDANGQPVIYMQAQSATPAPSATPQTTPAPAQNAVPQYVPVMQTAPVTSATPVQFQPVPTTATAPTGAATATAPTTTAPADAASVASQASAAEAKRWTDTLTSPHCKGHEAKAMAMLSNPQMANFGAMDILGVIHGTVSVGTPAGSPAPGTAPVVAAAPTGAPEGVATSHDFMTAMLKAGTPAVGANADGTQPESDSGALLASYKLTGGDDIKKPASTETPA